METKIGTYAELGGAADKLRRKVFIEEQGVPEDEVFDDLNEQPLHAVIFESGFVLLPMKFIPATSCL